jgi:hypothetical protein
MCRRLLEQRIVLLLGCGRGIVEDDYRYGVTIAPEALDRLAYITQPACRNNEKTVLCLEPS